MAPKNIVGLIVVALAFLLSIATVSCAIRTIEPGHVGVAVFFGEVDSATFAAGTHFANPMLDWTVYDCRQKTHSEEGVGVPTGDQMTATVDVSVQYRAEASMVHTMLSNTGTLQQVVDTHLVPKLRSLLREQGKGLKGCEDFFSEDIQQKMQTNLKQGLTEFLEPKGLIVEAVLIRDVNLPPVIVEAIQSRKTREQEAERQKVELERYRTEQEQRIVAANADRQAAEQESVQIKTLADARAYEIATQGKALLDNPDVLRWEAVKKWNGTLPSVLGGDASMLLNIGGVRP